LKLTCKKTWNYSENAKGYKFAVECVSTKISSYGCFLPFVCAVVWRKIGKFFFFKKTEQEKERKIFEKNCFHLFRNHFYLKASAKKRPM